MKGKYQAMEGLRDLHATIDEATEALGAFVSVTRSNELVPELLVEVANKVVSDLAEWRATLRQIVVLEDVTVTRRELIH